MEDTPFIAQVRHVFGDRSFTAQELVNALPKHAYPDPVRYHYFGSHRFEKAITVRSVGILLGKDPSVQRVGGRGASGNRWKLAPAKAQVEDEDSVFD